MYTTQQQEVINGFIINSVLISPVEKMLSQLENKEFRDCDIKWLDSKFKSFTDLAAETLGIKPPAISKPEDFKFFNPYVQNYYTERFKILLDYFKKF